MGLTSLFFKLLQRIIFYLAISVHFTYIFNQHYQKALLCTLRANHQAVIKPIHPREQGSTDNGIPATIQLARK